MVMKNMLLHDKKLNIVRVSGKRPQESHLRKTANPPHSRKISIGKSTPQKIAPLKLPPTLKKVAPPQESCPSLYDNYAVFSLPEHNVLKGNF